MMLIWFFYVLEIIGIRVIRSIIIHYQRVVLTMGWNFYLEYLENKTGAYSV